MPLFQNKPGAPRRRFNRRRTGIEIRVLLAEREGSLALLLHTPKQCYSETMPGEIAKRRWPWKGLLGVVLVLLLASACHRRAQPPPAPPPPDYLQLGDKSYDAGNYPAAIAAYSAYLREHPDDPSDDRVLLRLGLASTLPPNASHDPAQAITYWNQLTSQYPASPLRPEAELLAGLEQQLQQLRVDVKQRESQIASLTTEMKQVDQQRADEMEQIQSDLKNREERIRQLSGELEKLKAIDMQRRPTTPPQ
jgi:tetratricopeptide (TPR) repeat protein